MTARGISRQDARAVSDNGEIVERYPEDSPWPSALLLDWVGGRPIHVVLAVDEQYSMIVIVTAYEPDPERWESDFRRRRI